MTDAGLRTPPTRQTTARPWPEAAIVVLTLAVFGQVASFGFVTIDDTQFVTQNPVVRSGLSAASLRWATSAVVGGNWVPVAMFSHLLDAQVFGSWAGGHHLTSLALHLGSALLLWRLLAGITGNRAGSLLAALIFAVHPLNAEPLAWVAQRRTLLMTLFGLLAAHAWQRHLRRPGVGPYLLAILFFALGLLSKPLLVALPLLLILLDAWPFGRWHSRREPAPGGIARRVWRLTIEKAPFFALGAAVGIVALRTQAGAMSILPPIDIGQRVSHALVAVVWYLGKIVWPSGLAVFYPYPLAGDPPALVIACAAAVACAFAIALGLRRRAPFLAVGSTWFVIALLPVSGVLQVGQQAYADRYAHLPMIGLLLALAAAFPSAALALPRRGPAIAAAAGCAVLALGVASFAQARHWRDGAALFTRALAVTGKNHLAHNNMGSILLDAGDLDGAERHFRAALRWAPRAARPHRNLGMVQLRRGDGAAAAEEFRNAVGARPADARAHRDLGRGLEQLGHRTEAMEVYREALRFNPDDPVTRKLLERLETGSAASVSPPPP